MRHLALALSILLLFFVQLGHPPKSAAQNSVFAQFELAPNKTSYVKNDKVLIDVYALSSDTRINAVEAHIQYPVQKLGLLEVNTDKSEFDVGIPEKNTQGILVISRGSTDGIKGKNLVASLVFLAQSDVLASEITLTANSVIMDSETNSNILSGSTVQTVPPPPLEPEAENNAESLKTPTSLWEWVVQFNSFIWEKLLSFTE